MKVEFVNVNSRYILHDLDIGDGLIDTDGCFGIKCGEESYLQFDEDSCNIVFPDFSAKVTKCDYTVRVTDHIDLNRYKPHPDFAGIRLLNNSSTDEEKGDIDEVN